MNNIIVCSLASGSNGNAYYIEADNMAILVDVGISFRRLKNRAMTRQIDLKKIKAVLVTHEHSDHVYGLATLCRQLGIRAYMTRGSFDNMRPKYRPDASVVSIFQSDASFQLGPFTIHSFAKPHDVAEPCSFRVEGNGISVGVFTDIGAVCNSLVQNLSLCHLAFLESNYDEDMLWHGTYSDYLKHRITSGRGHLSNAQSALMVEGLGTTPLHTIFLSHLSQDNNRPDVALAAFAHLAQRFQIKLMSRFEASNVWSVSATQATIVPPKIIIPERLDRVPLPIN